MSPMQLRTLVHDVVTATTPRAAFGDGSGFVRFARPAAVGNRPNNAGRPPAGRTSRRYRLEFDGRPTARRSDGLWTDAGAEHEVTMRVLVDYQASNGDDEELRGLVAQDDLLLLRDRLCAAAAPTNGLQLVEEIGADDLGPTEDPTIRTFALTYAVRYYAALSPGA